MKGLFEKRFMVNGYGFIYLKALTEEKEIITGGSFFFNNKKFLTISISKDGWKKDDGQFFKWTIDDGTLFTKWVVIGLKKPKKTT